MPLATLKRPFFSKLLALIAITVALCSSATAGQYYRWTDENGVTHYTDKPPANRETKTVNTSNVHGTTPTSTPATEEAEASEETVEAPPVREKSPERCAIARQNLKSISENARVRIKENGEFRYLNEKEVNAKRQEARQTIKEDC